MTTPAERDVIRTELNKLRKMPPWGRRQGDQWDRLSNFIYDTYTLSEVWHQVNVVGRAQGLDIRAFGAYTVRRWYNHHSHDQILQIFQAHPDVRPEENRKHRTIDFYLRDLPFDLKISRFPRAYPENIDYAKIKPHHLAQWLYENQSKERRYHTGHRLFLILQHTPEPQLSWRLRCDFANLERLIQNFLDAPTLLGLTLTDYHTQAIQRPWAGVIFHIT
jgi:hypothetical protein